MSQQILGSSQKTIPKATSRATKSAVDSSFQQFLSFSLTSDQQALIPTKQLLEIVNVSLTQITAIAGLSSPSVMGIYNWRGDVIWVVDLASMLGYKPLYAQEYGLGNFQDKCHIIFLRSQDTVLGFAVTNVWQMMRCDPTTIQTTNLSFANQAMTHCCRGYWLSNKNETFLVLDGNAIAQIVCSR